LLNVFNKFIFLQLIVIPGITSLVAKSSMQISELLYIS